MRGTARSFAAEIGWSRPASWISLGTPPYAAAPRRGCDGRTIDRAGEPVNWSGPRTEELSTEALSMRSDLWRSDLWRSDLGKTLKNVCNCEITGCFRGQ